MYETVILFLSDHGFIPRSWCENLVKVAAEEVPPNNLNTLTDKINEWIGSCNFVPPNVAYLGLYSVAVMAWFILTGIADPNKDESDKAVKKSRNVKLKSKYDKTYATKLEMEERNAMQERVEAKIREEVARILEKQRKNDEQFRSECVEVQDMGNEVMEKRRDVIGDCNSPRSESMEKSVEMNQTRSKYSRGFVKPVTKPTVRAEKSTLSLKNRDQQMPHRISRGIVRKIDEPKEEALISDTRKELENKLTQSNVALMQPARKPCRRSNNMSGDIMQIYAGKHEKFQNGSKNADKINEIGMNSKVPEIVVRPYPKFVPSPEKTFRLGGTIRKSRRSE